MTTLPFLLGQSLAEVNGSVLGTTPVWYAPKSNSRESEGVLIFGEDEDLGHQIVAKIVKQSILNEHTIWLILHASPTSPLNLLQYFPADPVFVRSDSLVNIRGAIPYAPSIMHWPAAQLATVCHWSPEEEALYDDCKRATVGASLLRPALTEVIRECEQRTDEHPNLRETYHRIITDLRAKDGSWIGPKWSGLELEGIRLVKAGEGGVIHLLDPGITLHAAIAEFKALIKEARRYQYPGGFGIVVNGLAALLPDGSSVLHDICFSWGRTLHVTRILITPECPSGIFGDQWSLTERTGNSQMLIHTGATHRFEYLNRLTFMGVNNDTISFLSEPDGAVRPKRVECQVTIEEPYHAENIELDPALYRSA
jgi:hypothetical protein